MSVALQLAHAPLTAPESVPAGPPLIGSIRSMGAMMGVETTSAEPIDELVGVPVHVRIPAIKVDAVVREMGVRPDGKLDAPKKRLEAGWYKFGARPGEDGTAVIDGHLNLAGRPGVFWRLRDVEEGDLLYVTDDIGNERTFRVSKTQVYHVSTAPLRDIFTKTGGKFLHLITCAGVWREELNHYDKRLVVYAELIES